MLPKSPHSAHPILPKMKPLLIIPLVISSSKLSSLAVLTLARTSLDLILICSPFLEMPFPTPCTHHHRALSATPPPKHPFSIFLDLPHNQTSHYRGFFICGGTITFKRCSIYPTSPKKSV